MNVIVHDELAVEALSMEAIELFGVADGWNWWSYAGDTGSLSIHSERPSGTRLQRRLEAAADQLLLANADLPF